ncbi:GtrA family protein [Bombilactobacillus thymidiniphilus]|uniref:GtrA family protein n=1 Tax=Bombilactobacillus thymidiniphilus TaxID=2923363 RepID=A0ABY4PC78_9LACO|nr:GtrA family protein [Bombilactobacillus thymidiniphilus]
MLHNQCRINILAANTWAWLFANIFSFIANKKFVFKSKFKSLRSFGSESCLFLSQRILALICDNIFMWLGVNLLHWNNILVKVGDQILVGLLNYLSTQAIFSRESSHLVQYISNLNLKIKKTNHLK